MLMLESNGGPALVFKDSDEDVTWTFKVDGGDTFVVDSPSTMAAWSITEDGDLEIAGSLTANGMNYPSDINKKNGIVAIEPRDILRKVVKMPISEWSYNFDKKGVRHVGPMAQDFRAVFGLGKSDKSINVSDAGGVALAVIQGLNQVVKEKDAEIDALKVKSDRMEKQLQFLMKEVEAMKKK